MNNRNGFIMDYTPKLLLLCNKARHSNETYYMQLEFDLMQKKKFLMHTFKFDVNDEIDLMHTL